MPFEMRPNSGVLFRNDDKEKETHADYQGEALIDGKTYWLNAWIKTGKSGRKFLSCSFREKAQKSAKSATEDEDIPF